MIQQAQHSLKREEAAVYQKSNIHDYRTSKPCSSSDQEQEHTRNVTAYPASKQRPLLCQVPSEACKTADAAVIKNS